jgi:hypothetical protein
MQPNSDQFAHIIGFLLIFYAVIFVVAITVVIIPTWFICKKAGFSPWLSLLNIIPLGSLVLLYVLAFAEWKVVPAAQVVWTTPPLPPQPLPPQTILPPQA